MNARIAPSAPLALPQSARSLRVLQIAAIALAVAGNLTFMAVVVAGVVPPDVAGAAPLAACAGMIVFAVACLRAQNVARALGSTVARSNAAGAVLLCVFVSFVGVPLLIWRSAQSVAAAVGDDGMRNKAILLAWAYALSPLVTVAVSVGVIAAGGNAAWYFVGQVFGVALLAVATQLILGPLIAELDSRAPLGGVDGDATSAAVRSL